MGCPLPRARYRPSANDSEIVGRDVWRSREACSLKSLVQKIITGPRPMSNSLALLFTTTSPFHAQRHGCPRVFLLRVADRVPRRPSHIAPSRQRLRDPAALATRCVRKPRAVGFPPSSRSFNPILHYLIFLFACFDSTAKCQRRTTHTSLPPIFAEDASRSGSLDTRQYFFFLHLLDLSLV